MITVLFILLILTPLGFLLKFSTSKIDELLLSSLKGYILVIGLSYCISYNFMIDGATSVLISLIILYSLLIIKFFRALLNKRLLIFRKKIVVILLYVSIIPICTILVPSFILGIGNFYGVYNFDFFYNSQDALFLSTNSVTNFYSSDNIFPIDWSANPQGRFAISLIGAFVFKYLSFNPLEFNSYLLSTLIIISAQVFFVFARRIFMMNYFYSFLSVFIFILSAHFVQGYIYYLLGQISAIPVFIYVLLIFRNLLKNQNYKNFFWLVFTINILYFIYAILSFYAFTLFFFTSLSLIYLKKINIKYSNIFLFIFSFIIIFVLLRISNLHELYISIIDWIALSFQTASAEKGIMVFSEYLTETGLMLQWGLINYPSSVSVLNFSSFIFISMGLIATLSYLFIILKLRNLLNPISYFLILVLSGIVISSSILFYIIKSPYPLFKTFAWFIPILLPLFLYGISKSYKRFLLSSISIVILGLNLLTSVTYLGPFFLKKENPYLSTYLISKDELIQLNKYLKNLEPTELSINMTDGIHSSWFANFFREFKIHSLTHNRQPLFDKELDNSFYELSGEYLITQKNNFDIFDRNIYSNNKPLFETENYELYRISDIDILTFIGTGTYQPTTIYNDKIPNTFRWVEKGLELLVYSNKERMIELKFDVQDGYVKSANSRTINVNTNNIINTFALNGQIKIELSQIVLKKGINKIIIKSDDEVYPMDRYNALFRKDINLDTRLLNFRISNISIIKKEH